MKKRSVLYTWVIEFSILLILMAAMCVTLTLSARRKLLDEYTEITIQQQEKIETALNNSMSQIKTDAINLACNNVIRDLLGLQLLNPVSGGHCGNAGLFREGSRVQPLPGRCSQCFQKPEKGADLRDSL